MFLSVSCKLPSESQHNRACFIVGQSMSTNSSLSLFFTTNFQFVKLQYFFVPRPFDFCCGHFFSYFKKRPFSSFPWPDDTSAFVVADINSMISRYLKRPIKRFQVQNALRVQWSIIRMVAVGMLDRRSKRFD